MWLTALHVIKLLALPPALLIILAVVGLLCKKRKFGLPLVLFSLSILLMLSLPIVVNLWAQNWERFPPVLSREIRSFRPEALVVIGGGVSVAAEEYHSPVTLNTRSLVRVRYAAKLARELGLPVLVSGGVVLEQDAGSISEAQLMADVLEEEFKIPVTWLEPQSRNTAENALFSRELLRQYGLERIMLVTQAYHMPRAANEFRKAGFLVLPAPTDFIGQQAGLCLMDFVPSPAALMHVFLLAHEGIGMLWYRARY
jgi:uncharacterized SAM-binding protein YcdF (DUF218 family)